MKKQRFLSILLVLCMVAALLPTAALAVSVDTFTDVSKDAWYYDYIDFVTSKGYYDGVTETTFEPDSTMTRAMFVVVLARVDGATVDNNVSPFDDVHAGDWFAGAVKWAADRGIVEGIGNNLFDPDGDITREDMCVIMSRFITYYSAKTNQTHKQQSLVNGFTDAGSISSYAASAVEACRGYGLIDGYEDGTFRPQGNSTRAEVAAVIRRLAWLVKPSESGSGPYYPPETKYTVEYIVDKATVSSEQVAAGTEHTVKNFHDVSEEIEKQVFVSWLGSDGKLYAEGDVVKVTGNLTFTATFINDDDYIGLAVKATMDRANEEYFQHLNAQFGSNYFQTAAVAFNPIKAPDDDTRAQSVSFSAAVTDDLVKQIIELATTVACSFIRDFDPDNLPSSGEIKDTVSYTVDDLIAWFEALTGINFERTDTVQDIKDKVYNRILEEGQSYWAYFRDADGKYYTGNVTMTVNGDSYTFTVAQPKGPTTYNGSKRQAITNVALAIAKDLYADLKENDGTYVNKVHMESTVTFKFTDGETYGAATEAYPHVYPVTVSLDLYGEELLAYKYNAAENRMYVKLNLTQPIQNEYASAVESIINAALSNGTVAERLTTEVEKVLGGNGIITSLKDVLGDDYYYLGKDENGKNIDPTSKAVESWIGANLSTAPIKSDEYILPYYFLWTLEGTIEEGENASYVLKDKDGNVIGSVGVKYDNEGNVAGKCAPVLGNNSALYGLIVTLCEKVAESIAPTALEEARKNDLWDSSFLDGHRGGLLASAAESELRDAKYDDVPDAVKHYLCNLIVVAAAEIAPEEIGDVTDFVNGIAEDEPAVLALVDEMVCKTFISYETELGKALKIKTLEKLEDVQLSNLATVLKNGTVQNYLNRLGGASYIEKLTNQIRRLPAGASLTIWISATENVIIDKALLTKLQGATDAASACSAVAEIINSTGLKTMSLSDFYGEGAKITVRYNSRTFTFNGVVELVK